MKPKKVIVGTGLGECYLAAGVVERCDVTMTELSDQPPRLRDKVIDVAKSAVTYPHIESGFGGSTKTWHNALMEIDAPVFDKKWLFLKEIIARYYEWAYRALAGTSRQYIYQFADALKGKLENMGFSESLLAQNMFIPKTRINAWNALSL